jgi:hypothetical protein
MFWRYFIAGVVEQLAVGGRITLGLQMLRGQLPARPIVKLSYLGHFNLFSFVKGVKMSKLSLIRIYFNADEAH